MARALVLKDNPNPSEEENLKWQLLQVSTLSVASCIGRLLIGIRSSGAQLYMTDQTSPRIGVTTDFAKHKGIRSAQLISGIAATFFVSQLVGLLVQDVEYLQYPVFLVGISFGGTVGLVSIIVIEWFGTGLYSCLLTLEPQELTSSFHCLWMITQPMPQKISEFSS
jgi:hypothetical protein